MALPTHLRSLQAVELAARTGSLAKTAEMLGISPAAVGQRVRALEEYLGAELLLRGRAGILPAPALQAALPHLRDGFAALAGAADALELQRGSELHIAAPTDFAELWLQPRLHRFRAVHPNLRFCVNGEGDAPLRLGRVDCEIRFGPPPRDGTDSLLLFHDLVTAIGSPANLARTADLPPAERLEGFPLLHLDLYRDDPAGISWPRWIELRGWHRTAPARGIRFQRIRPALDAVLADAGFVLCGLALLEDPLARGTIRPLDPEAPPIRTGFAYTAGFRPDAQLRAPLWRFRHWLAEEASATRDRLAACA